MITSIKNAAQAHRGSVNLAMLVKKTNKLGTAELSSKVAERKGREGNREHTGGLDKCQAGRRPPL